MPFRTCCRHRNEKNRLTTDAFNADVTEDERVAYSLLNTPELLELERRAVSLTEAKPSSAIVATVRVPLLLF